MTNSLAQLTILIVEGRSISAFKLRSELEEQGAFVCAVDFQNAEAAVRHTKPDVVLVDFSLSDKSDALTASLQDSGTKHLFCSSPNRQQSPDAQSLAAQDVAVALAEIVTSRPSTSFLPWQAAPRLDPELYAI